MGHALELWRFDTQIRCWQRFDYFALLCHYAKLFASASASWIHRLRRRGFVGAKQPAVMIIVVIACQLWENVLRSFPKTQSGQAAHECIHQCKSQQVTAFEWFRIQGSCMWSHLWKNLTIQLIQCATGKNKTKHTQHTYMKPNTTPTHSVFPVPPCSSRHFQRHTHVATV